MGLATDTLVPMTVASNPRLEQNDAQSSSVAPMKKRDDQEPGIKRSLAVCALYGTTSISITFFNKAVFSVYGFRYPCFVTLLQIVVCLTFLLSAHVIGGLTLPRLRWETMRLVFPLSLCWWVYVVSGIAALRYLSIPMFATLRKSTVLIVLILEALLLKKRARASVWLSIFVMVAGGFVAGMHDLAFSLQGYVLVMTCCVSTAFYLILIIKVGKRTKLETFGLLFYNNVLAFPLMLAYLSLFTTELQDIPHFKYVEDHTFWVFLVFSAAQATLLNVAIFLCTKLNSPLATTVTGQVKDFITIGFGLFVFGDVTLNRPNLVGLLISMAGSFMYSMVKLFSVRAEYRKEKRVGEECQG